MGKIDNTKLIYTCGGLIIGLGILFALLFGNKSTSFLSSHKDSNILVVKTASGRTYVSGTAPKSTWKQIGVNSKQSQGSQARVHDSGYKTGSTYANDYIRAREINYPLIASAKFIKKKDKLKNKKKPTKSTKGKGRPGGADGDEDDDGLSESPEAKSNMTTATTATGTAKPKKTPEEEEENINTVEFWIEPIFEQENPEAVVKLVDSYKVKKVSNGVFYTVVTQMNEDSRVNIREMGLDALTSTPGAQSFSQLTWIKHNDTEASLRTEAGRQVATYSDLSKLGYVVSTLKTETAPGIAVEALRTLTASTKKYGELHAQSAGNPNAQPVNMSALETRYTRALEVIEQNNYSNSSDATVKTEATKTVAAINKFNTI